MGKAVKQLYHATDEHGTLIAVASSLKGLQKQMRAVKKGTAKSVRRVVH